MVALLCYSCEHRNPTGARFCNACGAPLHLKPCRHCEAINARAASHCHRCGEAFTFDFAALDRPLPDAADGAPGTPVEPPASPPRRSNALVARIGALVAVIAAMVLLPAFLSHNEQEQERVETAPPGAQRPAATPVKDEADARAPRRSDREESSAELIAMPSAAAALAAGATRADATSDPPPGSTPPVRVNGSTLAGGEGRPRAGARATRRETPASAPSVASREARSRPGAGPLPAQHRATPPPARLAAAKPGAVGDRLATTSLPPDTLPGRWQRPCNEGSGLDAGCDVRLLPKGN